MEPFVKTHLHVWNEGHLHYSVALVPATSNRDVSLYFEKMDSTDSVFHQLVEKLGKSIPCKSMVDARV